MRVAILGATGAVGREFIRVLEQRAFPMDELVLLASPRSVGKRLPFRGGELEVRLADEKAFAGCDIVLSAVGADISRRLSPCAVAEGAVVIDNSSAFRLDPQVPLVVPEVNSGDIGLHRGIIANPNCSTIIAAVAINPIHRISPVRRLIASTYQAVSGAGAGGIVELEAQMRAIAEGGGIESSVFPYQIACNLIPQIGGFDGEGHTSEEMKLQNEGRKIMHNPDMAVSCTCVRVPVLRSHSISICIETQSPVSVEQAKAAIAAGEGCRLVDDPASRSYPMPLDTSGQDLVFVGRIRRDLSSGACGLALWCCGDQIRKGAATNAVQIAEALLKA